MDYGPGSGFTIDSQKSFEFKMEFPTVDGILKGIVTLSQGGKSITGTLDNLEGVRAPLTDGMVLDLDSWENEDIQWLDGGVCHKPERCNRKSVVFSNIVLERLSDSPAPAPAPSPPSGNC